MIDAVPPTSLFAVDTSVAASAATGPTYHYVIVRRDLSLGVQAAMLVHAAGESGPTSSGTYAVALTITDQDALMTLHLRLLTANIPHTLITEPDLPGNPAMAIGCLVADRKEIRKLTSSLPLFKDRSCRCMEDPYVMNGGIHRSR